MEQMISQIAGECTEFLSEVLGTMRYCLVNAAQNSATAEKISARKADWAAQPPDGSSAEAATSYQTCVTVLQQMRTDEKRAQDKQRVLAKRAVAAGAGEATAAAAAGGGGVSPGGLAAGLAGAGAGTGEVRAMFFRFPACAGIAKIVEPVARIDCSTRKNCSSRLRY